MRSRGKRAGLTLVELIVAFTILLILSTMALPLARVKVQREKERRLRDALTEMRKAIDRYKDAADAGKLGQVDQETHGYPESLEILVEGVPLQEGGGMGGLGGFGQQQQGGQGFGRSGRQGSGRSGSRGSGSSRGGGFGNSRGGSFGGSGNRGSGGSRSGGSGGGGFGSSGRGGSGRSGSQGFGRSNRDSGRSGGFGSRSGQSDEDDEEQKVRFLRRIPVDPITGSADWGMRSVQDEPESMSWGGQNVFDVHSMSMEMALDGTKYSDW